MTMIDDDINKKVIFPQISPISGPSLGRIMSKIFWCIPYKYKDWRSFSLKQQIIDIKLIFYIFLIISYKFGAYIKRFWYTFLTNWIICDYPPWWTNMWPSFSKIGKKVSKNLTAKFCDILTVSYKKLLLVKWKY